MQKTVKNLCGSTFTKRLKCEAAVDNAEAIWEEGKKILKIAEE